MRTPCPIATIVLFVIGRGRTTSEIISRSSEHTPDGVGQETNDGKKQRLYL